MSMFSSNKRSLSESSAEDDFSLSARKMCHNELSINPDSVEAQPAVQRHKSQDVHHIDNKMKKSKKINLASDIIDVGLRIILMLVFIKLRSARAFQRNIHVEELWMYKNPHTDEIASTRDFAFAVFLSPLVISILQYLISRDWRDFRAATWAWTLSLCLNGVTTDMIKITVGRPRPDFFYRCFPDGQMMANVTPTAVNLNCTGEWHVINQGYKSFPSGHSAFTFCSFGFVAIYMAGKLHAFNLAGRGETWRVVGAVAPLYLAMLVAISRTCDYHHHWQDVTVGSLIGLSVAYITYRQYYPSIFSCNSHLPLPRDYNRLNFCYTCGCRKNEDEHYEKNPVDTTMSSDNTDCEKNMFGGTNAPLNGSNDDQLVMDEDDDENYQK